MKTIKYSQQSFGGTTALVNGKYCITFKFDKIYKTNPLNKLKITPTNLGVWVREHLFKPHAVLAEGLSWGGCATSGAYSNGVITSYRNDYCLGIVGGGIGTTTAEGEGASNTIGTYVVVDEITPQPFIVYVVNADLSSLSVISDVFMTFQIEEVSLEETQHYR